MNTAVFFKVEEDKKVKWNQHRMADISKTYKSYKSYGQAAFKRKKHGNVYIFKVEY